MTDPRSDSEDEEGQRDPLPELPFRMILAGPSMSGKTRFLVDTLAKMAKSAAGRFDSIMVIAPPMSLEQGDYSSLGERLRSKKHDTEIVGLPSLPSDEQAAQLYTALKEGHEKGRRTLIIIDDFGAHISRSKFLQDLCCAATHHAGTSVALLLQNLMTDSVGRTARLNSDYVVLFSNPADKSAYRSYFMQLEPDRERWPRLIDAAEHAHAAPYQPLIVSHKDMKMCRPGEWHYRLGCFEHGLLMPWLAQRGLDLR